MGSGIPLTDDDRWDWLIALRTAATDKLQKFRAIVVTCSSLRRRYRDVFRVVSYASPSVQVYFIYLKVDQEHLKARIAGRVGHYMKENMLHSQLECLEEPALDELDVVKIDEQEDQAAICKETLAQVRAILDATDNTK